MMRTSTFFGLGAADRHEHALLQDAQELHLERGRHVADLVHEEGAAVGDREEAGLVGDRAGERAAAVTEELALEEVVVEGAAVGRDERLVGPPRLAGGWPGATSSLPVPFSPRTSTVASLFLIRSSIRKSAFIASLESDDAAVALDGGVFFFLGLAVGFQNRRRPARTHARPGFRRPFPRPRRRGGGRCEVPAPAGPVRARRREARDPAWRRCS